MVNTSKSFAVCINMYSIWVFDIHRELWWIEFGIPDKSAGPAEPGSVGYAREAVLFWDWDPCVGHSMLRPPEEREGGCTEVSMPFTVQQSINMLTLLQLSLYEYKLCSNWIHSLWFNYQSLSTEMTTNSQWNSALQTYTCILLSS